MTTTTEATSIYHAIGGRAALVAAVDDFYGRLLADPGLAPFFPGGVGARHRAYVVTVLGEALGGPRALPRSRPGPGPRRPGHHRRPVRPGRRPPERHPRHAERPAPSVRRHHRHRGHPAPRRRDRLRPAFGTDQPTRGRGV